VLHLLLHSYYQYHVINISTEKKLSYHKEITHQLQKQDRKMDLLHWYHTVLW